jgi:hypothetical protein
LADDKTTSETKPKAAIPVPVPVVVGLVGVLVVAGIFAYLTFGPKPAPPAAPVLTQEAKDYLGSLPLSDVKMQASESYINQSLVEILGKIGNTGNRGVKLVQVNCVFVNVNGQALKRELVTVVGKNGGLRPGETRPFRLAFDNPPAGWNQALPALVIAQIQFD